MQKELQEMDKTMVGEDLKQEILKFAVPHEKLTQCDDGVHFKEIKSVFGFGSPVYKY